MYTPITLDQFSEFIIPRGFIQVPVEESKLWTGEYIFEKTIEHGYIIQIYSSISIYTNKTRNVGTDAIRVVVLDRDHKVFHGNKRVNRVDGWRNNLDKRLENWKGIITWCQQCGSPLWKRKGKHGFFLGCSSYPSCGYTEKVKE